MGIMMMSLVVGKVIITLILDGLFQGKLSNLIIGILMKMNLSQAEADVIYQNVFRANRDVFQWIGFMLLFLVGYYAVLSKTANYLKNIGDGIDNVLANSKQPIELETELEPIAEKLNTMKMTLARKERMAQEADAVIALPGGCGTMEELFEIITWKQLGLFLNPIVILNIDGYYNPLIEMLHNAIGENFMRQEHARMWQVAQTPQEAVDAIQNMPVWDKNIRKIAAI